LWTNDVAFAKHIRCNTEVLHNTCKCAD